MTWPRDGERRPGEGGAAKHTSGRRTHLEDTSSEADVEVVRRLAAAATVIEAVLTGRWLPTVKLLDALAELLDSAASWSRRAAA